MRLLGTGERAALLNDVSGSVKRVKQQEQLVFML